MIEDIETSNPSASSLPTFSNSEEFSADAESSLTPQPQPSTSSTDSKNLGSKTDLKEEKDAQYTPEYKVRQGGVWTEA